MVYTALFRHLAPQWVHAGAVTFAVTLLAQHQAAVDAWCWNGFGLVVIDAVRPPTLIDTRVPSGLHIRQAMSEDVIAVTTLLVDHSRYMSAPPVCLVSNNDLSPESIHNRINKAGHIIWIAVRHGEAVGMLEVSESVSGAAHVVSGNRGIGIRTTHVLPGWRGQGVASALLNTAIKSVHTLDVEMCSVDFEAYNPSARRFWLRYFTPACYSLVRRIDERSI